MCVCVCVGVCAWGVRVGMGVVGVVVVCFNPTHTHPPPCHTHTHHAHTGRTMCVFDRMHDLLGNGIFAVDGEPWRFQRKTAANICQKQGNVWLCVCGVCVVCVVCVVCGVCFWGPHISL